MFIPDDNSIPLQTYVPGDVQGPPQPAPTFGETFSSSMANENDVQNFLDYQSRKTFKETPGYSLGEDLKAKNLWEDRDMYLSSRSPEETDYTTTRIAEQRKNQAIRERAGWAGFVSDIAAGNLSPTLAIPFMRGGSLAMSFAKNAALVGAGTAVQESVLFANQETRTKEQAAVSIASSVVIGGLLGSLVHGLSKGERLKLEDDMAHGDGQMTIPEPLGFQNEPRSVGAQAVHEVDPGGLKRNVITGPVNDALAALSPVTRLVNQTDNLGRTTYPKDIMPNGSPQVRIAGAKFSTSGLKTEGNVLGEVNAPGGNVENNVTTYAGPMNVVLRDIDAHYNEMVLGDSSSKVLAGERSFIAQKMDKSIMKPEEFFKQVSQDVADGGVSENKYVKAASQKATKHIQEMYDEAVKQGIFTGNEKPVGNEAYITHLWNRKEANAGTTELLKTFKDHYLGKIQEEFAGRLEKLREKQSRLASKIEDAQRPKEEVDKLIEQFKGELQANDDKLPFDVAQAQLEAKNLNEKSRSAPIENQTTVKNPSATGPFVIDNTGRTKVDLQAQAKAAKERGGQTLVEHEAKQKELNRRIKDLKSSNEFQDAKFNEKLDAINKNEDTQINTLLRASKQVQKLLAMVSSATPEAVAKELTKFKNYFANTVEAYDRAEEKIAAISENDKIISNVVDPSGTRYHGSSEPVAISGDHSSEHNIYGDGFYTTDSKKTALGYTKKGKGKTPNVNTVHEKNPIKAFDLESSVPPWLVDETKDNDFIQGIIDDHYLDHEGNPKKNVKDLTVRKLYDEMRAESSSHGYTKHDVQDLFSTLSERIQAHGYNAIDHQGGVNTGKGSHNVRIYLNPEKDIELKKATLNPSVNDALKTKSLLHDKLDNIAARIESIDTFDKASFKSEVETAAKDILQVHNEINNRRALRDQSLREAAGKLSPEEVKARLDKTIALAKNLPQNYMASFMAKGDVDLEKGMANFDDHAQSIAEEAVQKILNQDHRLIYSDIIQEKRGPELAKAFDIPMSKVSRFLETDIRKIIAAYTHTLAADIELKRAFGTADMSEQIEKIRNEQKDVWERLAKATDKNGKPASQATIDAKTKQVNDFYDQAVTDLQTLQGRIRGTRGLPTDPDSFSARAAKTAMEINGFRQLGGAMLSSIPEAWKVIQRHGILNTYRDAFIPFFTAFKELRMSQMEGFHAGEINDQLTHTRNNSWNGIFDDTYRGTMLERGITYLSKKMGMVSLLDKWTDEVKKFASGVIVAKTMRYIGLTMGEKGTTKELQAAREYLGMVNIDPVTAKIIWYQVTNGVGGGKTRGVWLPNTENWEVSIPAVRDARRIFRAALNGEIQSTIVTPGLERSSWLDANIPARMLGQFKTFSMSSTQKTLMAGLQEPDVKYLGGVTMSLAFGALSYYLYAVAAGGATYDKMMKSIEDGNWRLWADEAISRSGQTAILDNVQRVSTRIPLINNYTSFSGGPITKQTGAGLGNELGGPTYDLLFNKLFPIASAFEYHKPRFGFDRRTEHLTRQLAPYQNAFLFRRMLNAVENAAGDALHLEGKRQ